VDWTRNPAPALRVGFNQIKGLSEAGAQAIVAAREGRQNSAGEAVEDRGGTERARAVVVELAAAESGAISFTGLRLHGDFTTVQELVFRSGINRKDLEALAAADALRGLSGDRHRAYWAASGLDSPGQGRNASFFADPGFADDAFGIDVLLPVPSESQDVVGDYSATGFTLRRHPLALLRNHLNNYQVTRANALGGIDNEGFAKVTGIVTCRQRPMTASGVTFITMEDETGYINVVIWPSLGERRRPVVRQAKLLGVAGHVQHSEGVTHLIASELVDLTRWLGAMRLSSRDFT
jgi:error-prone DNA polymerase